MVRIAGSIAVLLLACGAAVAQTNAPKSSSTAQAAIQQWSGTLMDANCAGGSQATSESESAGVDKGRPEKGHKKNQEVQSCPVSSSTTAFALKTKSGQVMKFDGIGNARAAEDLKNKWAKELSAGKPIHTKVSGTLSGDTVIVTSLG